MRLLLRFKNKVGQFLSTDIIRNVVCQTKSTINIFDIMNQGKILLINVSKGKIGEDNSSLLGAMFITKIQMAAMERVRIPEDERLDFYLYVDEFQNFATESFAGILSEARKYRLNLILAHQYVGQLVTDVSTRVRDAIFGNVGTMIVFRIGAKDAEFLEKEFAPEFSPEDMVNLPNYHIYLKMIVDGVSYRPFSATTLPPFKTSSSALTKEKIIENSRKKYGRPKYLVEEEINQFTVGNLIEVSLDEAKKNEKYLKSKKEVYAEELAELGIEFELKNKKNKFEKQYIKQKNNFVVTENKKETPDYISLKDLKTEEKLPKNYENKAVNIDSLKESIRKSLILEENLKEDINNKNN
ncbi:MAG: hypothetical protein KatS3mg093_270 [Candidatus Parcubacteria bacterium]|nr:MAG: hypothetical protein KatS3mg093_270 [Candidatus Parcubacteria bacterium]